MTEDQLIEKLAVLRNLPGETEWVEFKSARDNFHFDDLGKYFSALGNEANLKNQECGWLVFGVNDHRDIVGTNYRNDTTSLHSLKHEIAQHTNNNLTFTEIYPLNLSEGRVLLFQIPAAMPGIPISWHGHFYGRDGESLVPLNLVELDQIRNQTRILDFSSRICIDASIDDLSEIAISNFRSLWYDKSNNTNLLNCSVEQLLSDSELLIDGKLNYAALILLGKKEALSKFLPNAEIIYEYRNSETETRNQVRENYRIGFLVIIDKLWDYVNARNGIDYLQEKFLLKDIPYFDKEVIREAILNAVCHRDYQSPGSVYIRQFPKSIIIENPGGFPNGVNPDNILDRTIPRNRRIAEVFEKCGLVERSGQGADRMFRKLIEESKPLPDYSKSDQLNVFLKISAEIQDINFIKFISRIYKEKKIELSVNELLVLHNISHKNPIKPIYQNYITKLADNRIIQSMPRGKGEKFILHPDIYERPAKKSSRRNSLITFENKRKILDYLATRNSANINEIEVLMSNLNRNQIHKILQSLKSDGRIEFTGQKKSGFWRLKQF